MKMLVCAGRETVKLFTEDGETLLGTAEKIQMDPPVESPMPGWFKGDVVAFWGAILNDDFYERSRAKDFQPFSYGLGTRRITVVPTGVEE